MPHNSPWIEASDCHNEAFTESALSAARLDDRWFPKSVLCLRDYKLNRFVHDLIAGVTVGLVALPLALAFVIEIEKATFVQGSELLRNAGKSLEKAPFTEPFPVNSTAHLSRRGTLSCSSTGCSFVFPASVMTGPN